MMRIKEWKPIKEENFRKLMKERSCVAAKNYTHQKNMFKQSCHSYTSLVTGTLRHKLNFIS